MSAAIVAALFRTLNRDEILNEVLEIALQNSLSTIKYYVDQHEFDHVYRESERFCLRIGQNYIVLKLHHAAKDVISRRSKFSSYIILPGGEWRRQLPDSINNI